jgi:hypothetical protein
METRFWAERAAQVGLTTEQSDLLRDIVEHHVQQRLAAQASTSRSGQTPVQVSLKDLASLAETVPKFGGDKRFLKEFQHKVEEAFRMAATTALPLNEEQKVYVITSRLTGDAFQLVQQLKDKNSDEVATVDALVKLLQQQYGDIDEDYEAVGQLKRLRQNSRSVQLYITEFTRILRSLPEMDGTLANLFFLQGLDAYLSSMIRAQQPKFKEAPLEELTAMALRLEIHQPRTMVKPNLPAKPASHSPKDTNAKDERAESESEKLLKQLAAFNGYKPSTTKEFHAKLNASNPDGEKLRAFLEHHKLCLVCRRKGHEREACPKKK